MNLTGSHTFQAQAQEIWDLLMDPDTLAKITPGISKLEKNRRRYLQGAGRSQDRPRKRFLHRCSRGQGQSGATKFFTRNKAEKQNRKCRRRCTHQHRTTGSRRLRSCFQRQGQVVGPAGKNGTTRHRRRCQYAFEAILPGSRKRDRCRQADLVDQSPKPTKRS